MSPNNATQVINPSIKMDAMALEKVSSFLREALRRKHFDLKPRSMY